MVKDNPIHKQQIDPVPMADRFPYYDLDGQLAAQATEIHAIIAACQAALRKLAPEIYGSTVRVGTSEVIGHLAK